MIILFLPDMSMVFFIIDITQSIIELSDLTDNMQTEFLVP
jgi:hypothetical protein